MSDPNDNSLITSLKANNKAGETFLKDEANQMDDDGFYQDASKPRLFLSKGEKSPGLLEVVQ